MKVAVLNNDFRVYWKGRLLFLRQHLADKDVKLFAVELFGKGSPYDFDSHNADEPDWWSCLFPDEGAAGLNEKQIKAALFEKLDQLDADVIIGPSIVFFAGAIGLQWAKKNGRRFIMFDDAKPGQVKRNPIVQFIKDTLIAQADALWLPSASYDTEYAHFLKKGLLFFHGFSCINNQLFKSTSGYQSGSNTIVCVARLVPIKNLDNLLNAWQRIEATGQQASLVIVGDGQLMQTLQQQQASLGLKHVTFTGAISNDNLPAVFAQAGAFVLPSLSETWGLVINEAMAAGLPVLLSRNINAAQSLLVEGGNGFGFDPVNVDELTAAIRSFLGLNEAQKTEMSVQSLRLVNQMSYEAMGRQLCKALGVITAREVKRPGLLTSLLINSWNGRYNTTGWDRL